jgi:hypothetical protein
VTKAGEATIIVGEAGEPPQGLCLQRKISQSKRLLLTRVVLVTKILAPNLVVPGIVYKPTDSSKKPRPATLGDFASSLPFKIELPLTMLMKQQHDSPTSPITVDLGASLPLQGATMVDAHWEVGV